MDHQISSQAQSAAGRPLRFMQVHTFYDQYLAQLYSQFPALAQAPYATQLQVLKEDGFSAVHMLGFHMDSLGYETNVVIGNNLPAQYAWAFENGLAQGPRRAPSMREILLAQIEAFNPDILYLTDPIHYDSGFVRQLPRRPRLVLGWRAANVPADWDVSEFDVILSCLAGMRRIALERGARKAVHFYPGFPQVLFDAVKDVPQGHDVCFYGQVNGHQYPARIRMLHTLVEASLQAQYSLRMHVGGQLETATPLTRAVSQGAVYGMNLWRLLRASRLIFDVRGSIATLNAKGELQDLAGRETANMRLFEATGLGTCLLTEHYDNLHELFVPGKEIVTYASEKEMVDKLRHYLAHEEERQEIAAAGLARCQRDHSMAARIQEFHAIIQRHLARQQDAHAPELHSRALPAHSIERVITSLGRLAARGTTQEALVGPVLQQAMELAESLLQGGEYRKAMQLAMAAKALPVAAPGVDVLRARVFLALNQSERAREALQEELQAFPHSASATVLLQQIAPPIQ
ncbi:glycosyltransferase family protein [Megalodesulfovibrio paquesii]